MWFARHKNDVIALLLLVSVTVLVFSPVLVRGALALPLSVVTYSAPWSFSYDRSPILGTTTMSDLVTRYYPHRLFYAHEIAAGRLPLWNPYLLSGTPYMAMGNTSFFNPFSLLFVLLPTAYAFGFVAWLHWLLAGVFAWMVARYHNVSAYVALMASVVVMGNSVNARWLGIPDIGGVATWAPLVLLGASMLARALLGDEFKKRIRASMLLIGALLLSWSAQPEVSVYTTVASIVVVLATVWVQQRDKFSVALLWLGGSLVVFTGLFAPQLLPLVELSSSTSRLVGTIYDSPQVFTIVAPEFFASTHVPGDWGSRANSLAFYFGLVPLLLFVLGLWRARDTITRVWGGVAVLFLILSMSSSGSTWWQVLPVVSQFNDLSRALLVASVGIGVVIAREIEHSQQLIPAGTDKWSRLWLLIWGGLLVFHCINARTIQTDVFWQVIRSYSWVGWVLLVMSVFGIGLFFGIRNVSFRRLIAVALIVVAGTDVLWYWYPFQSMMYRAEVQLPTPELRAMLGDVPKYDNEIYPATQTVTFLRQQAGLFRIYPADYPYLQTNMTMGVGLYDIRGFESLFWGRYGDFLRQWEGPSDNLKMTIYNYATKARNSPNWFNFTNVKYLLFRPNSSEIKHYRNLKLVFQSDEGSIYENTKVLPRAYLVDTIERFQTKTELYNRLRDPAFAYEHTIVTMDDIPQLSAYRGLLPIPEIKTYLPGSVLIHVTVSSPVLLVLSDTNYPGWQVKVDGEPRAIYSVNGVFRGVYVDAGIHDISFDYWPKSLVIGICIFISTLIIVGIGWLVARALMAMKISKPAKAPDNGSL